LAELIGLIGDRLHLSPSVIESDGSLLKASVRKWSVWSRFRQNAMGKWL